jgi:predicted CXXCH cytochrome family protein
VAQAIQPKFQPRVPRSRMIVLCAGGLTAVVGLSVFLISRQVPLKMSVHRSDPLSPYKNTRAGVSYTGDATCIRCHAKIGETFRQHPMGRSLAPIAMPGTGSGQESERILFEAEGFQYSVENHRGRVFHRETRRDESGGVITQNAAEVRYILGSGRQGQAYLIERDGYLFQSPISWYTRAGHWGLSPGYEKQNPHFDRPVVPACLYCHANRFESLSGTINRYRQPIFQGHAIGCERCHGPGELHVRNPELADGRDVTIVNPVHLEPSLRDAVCEQCHLIGHRRVVKLDRQEEDYRPGLPFYRFWTVLERSATAAENRFVGQVEQMHESRCFLASQGRLGCISCHDPHEQPAPEARVAYYRDRCLECHANRNCSLPLEARLIQSRDNDCAACHMPRLKSSDVIHGATADHRISRRPRDGGEQSSNRAGDPISANQPVVIFHRNLMEDHERLAANRDIGVALCRDGPVGARFALPLLEAALAARPDDVIAWQSKGDALNRLGRPEEALIAFKKALNIEPNSEPVLQEMAPLAARLGRNEDAISYWLRAIACSPWRSDYHAELAPLYFNGRDWSAAANVCQEAIRLNPANLDVRKLLVRCYLRLGRMENARSEFETLLKFDPADRDDLMHRFPTLSNPK